MRYFNIFWLKYFRPRLQFNYSQVNSEIKLNIEKLLECYFDTQLSDKNIVPTNLELFFSDSGTCSVRTPYYFDEKASVANSMFFLERPVVVGITKRGDDGMKEEDMKEEIEKIVTEARRLVEFRKKTRYGLSIRSTSEVLISQCCSEYHMTRIGVEAVTNYRQKRENGEEIDNPETYFPQDGIFTFVSPNKHLSRVKYHEGIKDAGWMTEKDKNYLERMRYEATLLLINKKDSKPKSPRLINH